MAPEPSEDPRGPSGPTFVRPGGGSVDSGNTAGPVFVAPERTPVPVDRESPWPGWLGPVAVVVAIVGIVPLQAALAGAIIAVQGGGQDDFQGLIEDNVHWFTLMQDVAWIALAVALPLIVVRHLRPGQLGLRNPPFWRALGVIGGIFVLFWVLQALYASALDLKPEDNALLEDTGFGDSVTKDVLLALVFTVGAPVAEELIFRGLLFRGLRDTFVARLGSGRGVAAAAVLSGVVFGGIHAGGGQNAFLPVLMLLGILLALSYQWSGSIYVPMLIHSVNNTLATAASIDPTHDWIYAVVVAGPVLTILVAVGLGRLIAAWCRAEPPARPGPTQAGPPAAGPPPQAPLWLS